MQYSQQTIPPSNWVGSGLCDCFIDCTNCFVTYCFPCATYAENGVMLRGDASTYWSDVCIYLVVMGFTGCQCVLGMARRADLRQKYNLPAQPCNDCCVHWCCHGCALCQEYRELKIRTSVGVGTGVAPVGGQYVAVPTVGYYPPQQFIQAPPPGPVV